MYHNHCTRAQESAEAEAIGTGAKVIKTKNSALKNKQTNREQLTIP